ncbi:hypothetical protein EHS13_02980 [Paenibacillus psychroresistens]|uniref:DUF4185 domain-containing protein n=1 Tax=Paenibacillus psychroresistens TaxID=1778678 RepID=A0A6B8RCM0_9BACL|nr:hypothetical protein [Paenibacillus psychroresistens]QGQ93940.1 hypothetical protein EHS13_02980 [Paenibacillus psychroresistens]
MVSAFKAFIWDSSPPDGIPFEPSESLRRLEFTGRHATYTNADTWYPSWAADGHMYSPWTDGSIDGAFCHSYDGGEPSPNSPAHTGQARIEGDNPLELKVINLGKTASDASPYKGRYPCGSLVYNGIWYYGTYCLGPSNTHDYENITYNWPWLGSFVGFRTSHDFGMTWVDSPHTPASPLFGENGLKGQPVRIGSPHFVDFGCNMEHSPDGKAYLVAHGSDLKFYPTRFANNSWITGDQIYLLRVTPSLETMNDPGFYEFFAGHDSTGAPIWTNDFMLIQPILEWQNNMGCVTVTYNAPLRKFIMCVTDGGITCGKMNSYILEADTLTGPWKLITYMKNFGEQAYFLNLPSKFISDDGLTLWLCYAGNFAVGWNGQDIQTNPPGGRYAMSLQEIRLLG